MSPRPTQRKVIAPSAHVRLLPKLREVFSGETSELPFGFFMESISALCPELDGGNLFERCWQASRGAEVRGHRLSLMMSTGLRVLVTIGVLALRRVPDAADLWQLFPAEGYEPAEVSHISLVRGGKVR